MAPYLILFLGGGLLLSLGDRVHMHFGVLSQHDSSFFGQAWWVPLVFGTICAASLPFVRLTRRVLREAPARTSVSSVAAAVIVLMVAYAATGPLGHQKLGLTLLLGLTWLARAAVRRRVTEIAVSILLATGGALAETAMCAGGLFWYHDPDFIGIPMWLPTLYLHGGLAACEIEGMISSKPPARARRGQRRLHDIPQRRPDR